VVCFAEAYGYRKGTASQDAETKAILVQIGDLMQKCKNVGKTIKTGRPVRLLPYSDSSFNPPSRDVADTMVNLYIQSFESTHRILHVPTFWTEYHRYWTHPESAQIDVRLRILLVIAIGSSLSEHGHTDSTFHDMVHQWVYAAETWLSGPSKKDRLDIVGIQIHCLTMLARQVFSVGEGLVWVSMGSLIHRAMQIGLHRDPKHLPAMSTFRAELRRRLWATILELIVQSSLDSAMPPRISSDEFDTKPPSNINDDEMDESTSVIQPHPENIYTATSIQITLLNSLSTRLRILHLLNGLHSKISYPDVLALSSEITNAYRTANKFMKENEERSASPFHRNLLHYLVRRFVIPLHCPFACRARTNPLFYYSLKVSLDAAVAIVSPEPDKGFSRLLAIGGGIFREGILSAATVISLELIAQVEALRLDGTLYSISPGIKYFRDTIKDLLPSSLERIKQGETNVKSHMFLSMVLAQVEATENGSSRELKVAQSARDSLEICYNLLRARADILPCSSDMDFGPTDADGELEGYGFDFDFDFSLPDADFS
jgi:hypothetical protein